jgi:hypothetical protein
MEKKMTTAEIQSRHDEMSRLVYASDHMAWLAHNDRAWLLSDRKRLIEEHAEAILHKNLAIKSLEIINREQETEIKLLRDVVKACDTVFNDEGLELSVGFKMHEVARAALAEFDKVEK